MAPRRPDTALRRDRRRGALERFVERVQDGRCTAEKLVIVRGTVAHTGKDRLETGGLRGGRAADVQVLNHRADSAQSTILVEIERQNQDFERREMGDVCELGVVEVEAERALRTIFRIVEPHEGRVIVDESPDKPRARDPVDPETPSRRPSAVLKILAREPLDACIDRAGLVGRERSDDLQLELFEDSLQPVQTSASEIIDRLQGRAISTKLSHGTAHIGLGSSRKIGAQLLRGPDQSGELFTPVEEGAQPRILGVRLALDSKYVGG
ncbi:MAG TPA: hypothetical protein VN224_03770, partial [Xanthomonadales bacterium]|nr:hypothetical protein [Xanthomonadales bacterium]